MIRVPVLTPWLSSLWLGLLTPLGGVGMRRGRPAPEDLHVGDALDFWRVEAYWYLVCPLHRMVFSGLLENIARAANAGRHQTGMESA